MPASTVSYQSGRRVVRRRARPALDGAYDSALSELAPELRVALVHWVQARSAEQAARSALSTAMTTNGMRWLEAEHIARSIR
jgi:hypothetical protein